MIQAILHTAGTFLDLAALAAVTGMAWCLMVLKPNRTLPDSIAARMRSFLIAGLFLLIVSSLDNLVQRGIEMSGMGLASLPQVLPTVIFKTHYGHMWMVRIGGVSAAWLIVIAGRRWSGTSLFGLLLFCAAAAIAFSRSASGHPADFGDLSTQQIADWFHLLAVSCWAGTLFAIAVIFPPARVAQDSDVQTLVADIADRFYVLFGPLLTVLVITGLHNAWFAVGSFQALAMTPYGRLLSAKLLFFSFLTVRYVAPPQHGSDEAGFAAKFLRRTRVEAVLVVCILLFVSVLVHTIPALHQLHLARAAGTAEHVEQDLEPVVVLATEPAIIVAGTPVKMTVSIRDQDGRPLKGLAISHERILHTIIVSKDLSFFAHIHTEDTGPVTAEMIKDAVLPLRFTFPRSGEYLVGFDFATKDESFSKAVTLTVAEAPAMSSPAIDLAHTKNFGDYRVSLELPPGGARAGADTRLRFVIQKKGREVADLEPYLGAAMHLAVVPVGLTSFIHAHGEIPGEHHSHHDHLHAAPPAAFGPEIDADVVMPAAGMYKIFSQVQHTGRVLLFDFMVDVQ